MGHNSLVLINNDKLQWLCEDSELGEKLRIICGCVGVDVNDPTYQQLLREGCKVLDVFYSECGGVWALGGGFATRLVGCDKEHDSDEGKAEILRDLAALLGFTVRAKKGVNPFLGMSQWQKISALAAAGFKLVKKKGKPLYVMEHPSFEFQVARIWKEKPHSKFWQVEVNWPKTRRKLLPFGGQFPDLYTAREALWQHADDIVREWKIEIE